jgi:hypothetical protein
MSQDQDKKVQFLPFHALNEFMTSEFRLEVVRTALNALPELPDEHRSRIDRLTKRVVTIPGFRHSVKAPPALRFKPTAQAFEKSPDLVAAILAAWAEKQVVLRQNMFDLLTARGWELLPLDADRTRLPGFITVWPRGEDFDVINSAYAEKFPDAPSPANDISLMSVWLSGRLPYTFTGEDEEETPETAQSE